MSRSSAAAVRLELLLDDEQDTALAAPDARNGMAAVPPPAARAAQAAVLEAAEGGGEPPPPLPKRRRQPLIDTIESHLTAAQVLARFEALREAWYSPELAPFVAGIESLLQQESRLSADLNGLPNTDHRDTWDHEFDCRTLAHDPALRRLRVWQPAVWWMAPIVRRQDTPLNMRVPLADTAADFVRELSERIPPAWRHRRVVVQLEVETRLYWGGLTPRDPGEAEEAQADFDADAEATSERLPWQCCSFRGDGVGFSEDLLSIRRGEVAWLLEPRAAEAPLIRRTLRPGVGLLVAVPVVTLELQDNTMGWVKRQAERVLRWMGVKRTVADRDPTFVRRLQDDEAYWAEALGRPQPAAEALRQIERRGAWLAPASMPALCHRPSVRAQGERHVVLLHGGLSSVRAGFEAWLEEVPPAGRPWRGMSLFNELCVWRFEHDTFVRIHRNLNQLVDLLERQVIGAQARGTVVLLAHSRGGNVARFALPRLRQRWPQWRFYGMTAGSPHQGTGVFRSIGRRWSGVAGAVGWFREAASGVLDKQRMVDLLMLERALAYDIPPGFRDVEPAGVARMARGQGMPEGLWAWGSEWGPGDDRPRQDRLWRRVIEDWAGFEADGDGIVPKHSALGGLPEAIDASPVFHTAYFEHEPTVAQMRERLHALLDWPT